MLEKCLHGSFDMLIFLLNSSVRKILKERRCIVAKFLYFIIFSPHLKNENEYASVAMIHKEDISF